MTETNRYNNGKIYKLISPHTDKIYVGSTCKQGQTVKQIPLGTI